MTEQSLDWIDVLNHSIADAYSKGVTIDQVTISEYEKLRSKLNEALQSMKIEKTKVPPILNGNEIMQVLNIKPGPQIKIIGDYLKDLQDNNPNITKEEAINAIKNKGFSQQPQNNIVNTKTT
jgi:DNA-directed RNA polymerase subunit H (RpoH/RPB5)